MMVSHASQATDAKWFIVSLVCVCVCVEKKNYMNVYILRYGNVLGGTFKPANQHTYTLPLLT